MNRIYQVFVSSTFEDLQEERKEVMQALLELDCMPAGMELFPASNEEQWSLIKRVIDACDYYLLIIGGRYGSTNDSGISYTQMEYEYALKTGKPIISFLPKNPGNLPASKCEKDPEKAKKLEQFKELAKQKLIKYWENPKDLGSLVSRSVVQLIRNFPAEGWVRAESVVDEKSVRMIAALQRENAELREQLANSATEPPKGTEALAQGDDLFKVTYWAWVSFTDFHKREKVYWEDAFTWNELFGCIAPLLLEECREKHVEVELAKYMELHGSQRREIRVESVLAGHMESHGSLGKSITNGYSHELEAFFLTTESFGRIKMQLRALGLITIGSKPSKSSTETFWKLTPYGDRVATTLLAIKRDG